MYQRFSLSDEFCCFRILALSLWPVSTHSADKNELARIIQPPIIFQLQVDRTFRLQSSHSRVAVTVLRELLWLQVSRVYTWTASLTEWRTDTSRSLLSSARVAGRMNLLQPAGVQPSPTSFCRHWSGQKTSIVGSDQNPFSQPQGDFGSTRINDC